MPESGSGNLTGVAQVDYPEGFNKDNSVVISVMGHSSLSSQSDTWNTPVATSAVSVMTGTGDMLVRMGADNILIRSEKLTNEQARSDVYFRIILMKLPTGNDATLLGDVNLDGQITQEDKDLQANFIAKNPGYEALTFEQYANADCDVNRDGKINSGDSLQLTKYLDGQIEHL